jgi:hypothetical protein
MVQLIIAAGKIQLPDEMAIRGGSRININHAHGIALSTAPDVEQRDVSDAFWRGLHCHAR